ncbi:MAG: hypothetical protein JWL84_6259 [Rhodospirillales bacterium]|nr:hypothetical protein [Rhodospirillales bacterium]
MKAARSAKPMLSSLVRPVFAMAKLIIDDVITRVVRPVSV